MSKLIYTFILFAIVSVTTLNAQHGHASGDEAVSFDGNDLVSYFEESAPKPGLEKYTYEYKDLTLMFVTQENMEKFKADPEKFIPAYNGWCAIALTQGSWIKPDFNHYKIQDGELLFFEVRAFYNGKTAWEKDPEINRIVADRKYQELLDK